jgi:hypothetical protein
VERQSRTCDRRELLNVHAPVDAIPVVWQLRGCGGDRRWSSQFSQLIQRINEGLHDESTPPRIAMISFGIVDDQAEFRSFDFDDAVPNRLI